MIHSPPRCVLVSDLLSLSAAMFCRFNDALDTMNLQIALYVIHDDIHGIKDNIGSLRQRSKKWVLEKVRAFLHIVVT